MKKSAMVVVMAAVAASGCVLVIDETGDAVRGSDWQKEQRHNRTRLPELAIGTPIEQVRDDLGTPSFTEAFGGADGEYRVLFYRTHHAREDGETTRDETTPLVFRDGMLIGIGDDYYRRTVTP